LFPLFSPPDAPARVFATAQKWSGPALAALGLIGIAVIALLASESPFAGWILTDVFAPERVLPLIGLGAACGLVDARVFSATLLLFGLGIVGGSVGQDWLLWVLYNVPEGPTHLFLTGPISYLAIGLALVPGIRLLPWLLPIAAIVAGAMLSLAIMLTDPSLHDPAFTWTPVLATFWIVAAVALTLRAFRRGWFPIFGRILGSWLIAIGLLYGGASLAPILNPKPPPTDTPQESTRGAEMNRTIPGLPATEPNRVVPGLPAPEPPAFLPGGVEQPQQP
jgi:hypothetical protein